MKLETTYDEIQGTFRLCLRCMECTYGDWPDNYPVCPIHEEYHTYTASAGGLIALMMGVSQNKMEYTSDIAKLAYECQLCGSCDSCEVMPLRPPHNSPTDFIRFLRYQLVKKGLVPEGALKKLYQKIKENGDYSGEKLNSPLKSEGKVNSSIFFAECLHGHGQQSIYKATLSLLDKIGKSVDVYSQGGCCGSALYDMGFWDELNTLLKKRSKDLRQLKNREIVFVNPHCQEFMTKRYPQISDSNPEIRPKHISELLVEAFKNRKIKIKNKNKIKVSYHDPCYLGKELCIFDPPREVLSFLDGIELIEMKRNRRNSYCCGAGGEAGSLAFPDFSKKITGERLKEFKETGAELLITACPYCQAAFQNSLPAEEKSKVIDLVELVEMRIS
jgi:heterodisulfide reductase subunit D